MPTVAPSLQAHIMYTANGTANWTITPNVLNQTTMSWYHGSMGINTVPVAARSRSTDFRVPRYFNTDTDSGGIHSVDRDVAVRMPAWICAGRRTFPITRGN